MDAKEVHDVFYYLTEKMRPLHLRGNAQKSKFKAWKKKVKKITVIKKVQNRKLSLENSIFICHLRGKKKILVRKSQLDDLWKNFHIETGHQGML